MARLTEKEKKELLEDSQSSSRRDDFARISERSMKRLSLSEYIEFLNWSQQFMKEDVRSRPPIQGTIWKI